EDRLYDQHFVGTGRIGRIDAFMRDYQEDTLTEWIARHNRWSSMEADEALAGKTNAKGQIQPSFSGNRIQQARAKKGLYYRMPLFFRAFSYFLYRYIFRLGFLDGKEGLIYTFLQALWFRFLVDAKIYEATRRNAARNDAPSPPETMP